ncbi:amino acid transporter [Neokomagataea thailandica NBRC 106555]|uniref:Amino acid permease n=2 Tax=Neokomagataea TaxID=1223423 RepID=A0A4Y6VAP9_9PROT|nr:MULTISPECIES: amino acid permease [Neokomagataea]QDH26008.1 amino acid permease [Neokomagataea tanensis]GBR49865.1 amino acid transporter [Neokomagataea thailandica NBRC 106555]
MSSPLWRKKPIQSDPSSNSGLKRVLGRWQLIALGVGVTIGAGLFSLTGVAAGQNAGPGVTLSYIIAAITCGFAGLCYGELASMMPSGGSAYTYSYAAFGEIIAWMIGWDLVLEYTIGAAAVASSWSGYVTSLLNDWGLYIDPRLLAPPMTPVHLANGDVVPAWFNAPAVFILLVVTALLMRGMSESTKINNVLVFVKVAVIVLVVAMCAKYINTANYHPFIPHNQGDFGQFGFSGVMRAAGMAFFAYIGFDIISTTAQDSKNPSKDLPVAMIATLLICAVVYAGFSLVLTGVVNYQKLANDPSPVATVVNIAHAGWLNNFVKMGISAGYISVIFGLLLGQARVFLVMSRDGLLPHIFSKLHHKTHTPWTSHLMFFVITSIFAAVLPIGELGSMTSIGTIFAFVLVCIGVPVLRLRAPDAERRFRVPGGMIVPILGTVFCGVSMASLDKMTWIRLLIWLVFGLVVYAFYGKKHSALSLGEK